MAQKKKAPVQKKNVPAKATGSEVKLSFQGDPRLLSTQLLFMLVLVLTLSIVFILGYMLGAGIVG